MVLLEVQKYYNQKYYNLASNDSNPNFTSTLLAESAESDSFSKSKDISNSKNTKSSNGKFDASEAGKNFVNGMIDPFKAIIKHPVASLGMIGGTAVACMLVPALGPVTVAGFGALGIFQMGKGIYGAISNSANGNYDAAEKSFNRIGEGFIGTLLSFFGLKQGAKIAREAKLMKETNTTLISEADKAAIAAEVKNASRINALKDNLSLIFSKDGLNALFAQFKPGMLKARFGEFRDLITFKKVEKKVEEVTGRKYLFQSEKAERFKRTSEGIRRAAMTDEQIETHLQTLADIVFDRLGVPKNQRPTIKIENRDANKGGYYSSGTHSINFNPESYRAGVFEIEDVIMHEGTHCKEALLRAGIPQDRVCAIIKRELSQRITNGENEKIFVSYGFVSAEMMTPPKMPRAMRIEFRDFAERELYNLDDSFKSNLANYFNQYRWKFEGKEFFKPERFAELEQELNSVISKLNELINKNPDFVAQYKSREEAMMALIEYSISHNNRYATFCRLRPYWDGNINKPVQVAELSGEELVRAEKSLVDYIDTLEGNSRNSGINGILGDSKTFNQYQFSPEEVLAQKNGNEFLIETIQTRIQEMKAEGTLSPEDEAVLLKVIEKSKLIIEYKTKGLKYYEKYRESINNPDNKNLAAEVAELERELSLLDDKINPVEYENITRLVKKMVRPDHATTMIPATVIYQLLDMFRDKPQV